MRGSDDRLIDLLGIGSDGGADTIWAACPPQDIKSVEGTIILTIPFRSLRHNGSFEPDRDRPRMLHTMTIRAYGPGILRISVGFGLPVTDESPMLQMDKDLRPTPLYPAMAEGQWTARDPEGNVRAVFNLSPPMIEHWSDLIPGPEPAFEAIFLPDGQRPICISAYDQFRPTMPEALGLALLTRSGTPHQAIISFHAEPTEVFAGTGERFAKLDLAGRTILLANQDAHGTNSRRAYKNVPFFLSSRLYGVFIHTSAPTRLSFADYSTRSVQIIIDRPHIDLFLIGGQTPEQILFRYRQITGFPSMPPIWSFGMWMGRMTYFSASEILQVCQQLRQDGWPCDVIHLDTGWFRKNWICDWSFNEQTFPDPVRLISQLRSMGFRLSLWQLPYLAEDIPLYQLALQRRYIGLTEGQSNRTRSNFDVEDYAGTIDLTNPEAVEWYSQLLRRLLQMGVSCIKADFGEQIHMDATYRGMEPYLLRNLYALLYQRLVFEVTSKTTGEGIIWARAGWAGCQRYPVHWAGDAASTWDGMAGSLRGGLHLGLSGFGFWSHDIPGFHGVPDFMNSVISDDLYVRWTQFGVFTSHMRYHGTSKREPYRYPKVAPIVRRWLRLRYALIPYIIQQARKVAQSGYPMLRALVFGFHKDPACWHIDDEYLFGDEFLVAPIMNELGCRDVYLPDGDWVDLYDGSILEGPRWLTGVRYPLNQMPVWARLGARIPIYPEPVLCTDQMDLSNVVYLQIDKTFGGLAGSPLGRLLNA